MKWNLFVGTVVLGVALCSQSYGFELLDRMLGLGGCGCETKCCTTKHHCAAKAACGCEAKAAGCAAKPACGCEAKAAGCAAKPACGCEAKAAGCAAKPTCGADKACGCERKCRDRCRPSLLERIFCCHRDCHHKDCHAKARCGCEAKAACGCDAPAPANNEMAPMPPAPIVDPSAYIPAQQHVVHASATLIR